MGPYFFILFSFLFFLSPLPQLSNDSLDGGGSLRILSAEGEELRVFRGITGAYSNRTKLEDYPDFLPRLVLMAEDKRFYFHPGVDFVAIARAFYQNIKEGRIVSGGSTITQQLARTIFPMPKNAVMRKMYESVLAVKLELRFSKKEILEAYLNRVPLNYNRLGFGAASEKTFQKSPALLTTYEAAALSVLIRRSNSSPAAFRKRFERLFHSAFPQETIDENIYSAVAGFIFEKSAGENPNEHESQLGLKAPHFVEWLHSQARPGAGEINTAISSYLNNEITKIVQNELKTLNIYSASNAAVVVLEIRGDESYLSALVGSQNFLDSEGGQVNGALAIRNGGSALKPFIFARAMEKFNLAPYSLISDSDISFMTSVGGETYRPRNYDLNYWGSLTLREALSTSRNIPAIILLKMISEEDFFSLMVEAGLGPFKMGPGELGPGMALGTMGVTLLDLTQAYTAFAHNGQMTQVYLGRDNNNNIYRYGRRLDLFAPKSAMYITSILSDRYSRKKGFGSVSFLDFPFEVAAKTGTSKDYRDAWTIGYTSGYVVGVWVGNFSGDPMKKVSGLYGAGRIFQQVMRLLNPKANHKFDYTRNGQKWVKARFCRFSGKMAHNGCPAQEELIEKDSFHETCSGLHDKEFYPVSFGMALSPVQGEVYLIDPHSPEHLQTIPLELAAPPGKNYLYRIDNQAPMRYDSEIRRQLALKKGRHTLTILRSSEPVSVIIFDVQ